MPEKGLAPAVPAHINKEVLDKERNLGFGHASVVPFQLFGYAVTPRVYTFYVSTALVAIFGLGRFKDGST